jgi:hypothetical protein
MNNEKEVAMTGDVQVMTENGNVPISDLKVGMSVLTEQKRISSVLIGKREKPEGKQMLELDFNGQKPITCSDNHLFQTRNRGWLEAKDLNVGDRIVFPLTNKISRVIEFRQENAIPLTNKISGVIEQ